MFREEHYLVLASVKLYLCRKWVAFDLNSNVLRRNYIEEDLSSDTALKIYLLFLSQMTLSMETSILGLKRIITPQL